MADFNPPEWLKNQTVKNIHDGMLAEIPDDIEKAKGGYTWDYTRPTALKISEFSQSQLVETIKCIFPMYADGGWLDLHAYTKGRARQPATKSTGSARFTGVVGTIINPGYKITTSSTMDTSGVEFETVNECIIGETGTIITQIKAVVAGAAGNVGLNTITLFVTPQAGITSVTNTIATSGGAAAEDDESLRSRIEEYDQSQGVSYVGSDSDYERWAKEASSPTLQERVGNCLVIPAEDTSGTVTLILTNATGGPASTELCTLVYNYIMRPDDPKQRLAPINTILVVNPPTIIDITVAATVELNAGAEIATVKGLFETSLNEYWPTATNEGEVKIAKVGALLFALPGVIDYSNLTLQKGIEAVGTINITIAKDELAQAKAVTLT